ncbi:MAG: DUF4020 domain-containing protein [Lachnospiraceae bacterium]|jgi:hypothetical protein|nr:DUF4020 domain-containing protein [Lachnospiraceae bacterium]
MVINGVDFPREILDAVNNNELVIFAGAGVSVDAPTSLPNFKGLTQMIAQQCGEIYDEDNDRIDEFLGDLHRRGKRVKNIVSRQLTANNPLPNHFHYNILDLFKSASAIRIVTTNQDEMFENAAKERDWKIPVYNSPAVPYGDSFNGVVHLHGNVKDVENIIITDEDFGKAYMLNGYATRFVVDMLKKYTVLFIGYSYDDLIVRYLTSSIPSESFSGAYILSSDDNTKALNRTGLKIIRFPEKDYDAECEAIRIIGEYTKRGLLDWKKRITGLNKDLPPADDASKDEILEGLKDIKVQEYLCQRINGKEWLYWLDNNGLFLSLFDETKCLDTNDYIWANWLIVNFVDNELLSIIKKHDNKTNYLFCEEIIKHFIIHEQGDDELFEVYISLYGRKLKNSHIICEMIKATEKRGMYDCMWRAFKDTFSYEIVIKDSYSFVDNKLQNKITYKWKLEHYQFKELWIKTVCGHLQGYKMDALDLCANTIMRLYFELDKKEVGTDIFSFNIIDIENNEKTHYRYLELYTICDIVKKSLYLLSESDKNGYMLWINKIMKYDIPLLSRLVLYSVRENKFIPSQEKIELLFANYEIHDTLLREQIFKLVAFSYDELSDEMKNIIINKILDVDVSGMQFEDEKDEERMIAYIKYNWFVWIQSQCQDVDEIEKQIKIINRNFPDFKPRKHPELIISPTEIIHGSISPISKSDLKEMSYGDVYNYLTEFKQEEIAGESDLYGLLQMFVELSCEDIKWTIGVVDEFVNNKCWTNIFWSYIFNGLRRGINKKSDFINVLNHINEDVIQNETYYVIQFISDILEKDIVYNKISKTLRERLFKIVTHIWDYCTVRPELAKEDMLIRVYNDSTGVACRVLVKLLSLIPYEEGIPKKYRKFIQDVALNSTNVDEVIFVLCAHASELFSRDNKWTEDNVLYYLQCENDNFVHASWEGFLYGLSDFNIPFASRILPIFHENIQVMQWLEKEQKYKFIHDYTIMLVYIDDNIVAHVGKMLNGSSEGERERFAFYIKQILENMQIEQRSELWNRWIKEYWELRIDNVPEKLCASEFSQMLDWVLLLENEFDEAAELACKSPIEKLTSVFLDDFFNCKFVELYPEEITKLLIYILLRMENVWIKKEEVKEFRQKILKRKVPQKLLDEFNETIDRVAVN